MTTLIDAVQKQDPGSGLVELFELELPDGTQYFHSGVDDAAVPAEIQFREKIAPYDQKTYTAIPIELTGIERKTDGASSRPLLTVANILSTFSDAIDMTNRELVGKRVIRRTTLRRYLVDGDDDTGTGVPPIEFPTEKFIIDRIASESKLAITFELAAASDLEGIKLPSRIVIGKYCGWEYQGHYANSRGGCDWHQNSKVSITVSGTTTEYKAYFNIDDEPIVLESSVDEINSDSGPTTWAVGTTYLQDHLVEYGTNTYWRSEESDNLANIPSISNEWWKKVRTYTVYSASKADYTYSASDPTYVEYPRPGPPDTTTIWRTVREITPAGQTPSLDSKYWVRGDLCGKLLNSCKCRFQYKNTYLVAAPAPSASAAKNTMLELPYGGFPGSEKYR